MSWELTGNAGTNPATNFLGTTDNEPLIIKTNGAERLRIDSTGNVGIGTAAPGRRLTLAGGPELALRLQDNTVPTGTFWELQASAFLLDHFGIVRYESGVAQGSKSLVIAPDGNVGIGTTEPRTPLHVLGRISTGADFTSAGAITFFPPDGFAWFHIDNGPAGGRPQGRLRISYGGTPGEHEIMSLDQSGNVGIGTSSPAAKLDVQSDSSPGVFAVSQSGVGMWGIAQGNRAGVIALSQSGTGILAAGHTLAGQFNGDVDINGNLFVSGTKSFKIDHPLDAAKKYLYHASVESPDMKNIYDGVVVLDAQGEAEVTLPAWFDALNTDFRYQLTAIGAAGPDLYIAEEMSANRFKIAGGKPNMKVCWQVTGIRQDAWAKAHPLSVEQDKPAQEQGYYLHPELYGESDEKSIMRARYPEMMQQP